MFESQERMSPRRAKLILLGLLAAAAISAIGCARTVYVETPADEVYVSDYDYLSDYGEWLQLPPYGMVWRPYVVMGWRPFYHGHWIWTYDGWAWISYEPYGWLVYHYGCWDYSTRHGWVWIPGDEWSPARVEWYTFGSYCAWAPLRPPHMRWHDPWDPYGTEVWIVVVIDDFASDNVGRHRIDRSFERDVVHRDVVYRRAPTREQVERNADRMIPIVQIEKRPVNVIPERSNRPSEPGRSQNVPLKRMVLPDRDQQKVRTYAPDVERNVLAPRSAERERAREQRTPEAERKENEKERKESEKERKATDKERKEAETKKKTRTR